MSDESCNYKDLPYSMKKDLLYTLYLSAAALHTVSSQESHEQIVVESVIIIIDVDNNTRNNNNNNNNYSNKRNRVYIIYRLISPSTVPT